MTEKLQLPNPAPKGKEHEKWEAMVESVIEFISASRTMLQVLNERVKDSQKYKEAEKRKIEDEKTKLAFYKDCLHVDVNTKKNYSKSSGTESVNNTILSTVKEGGDSTTEEANKAHSHLRVENNGDKLSVDIGKLDSAEQSKETDQPQIKASKHHRETCKKYIHRKNSDEKLCIENVEQSECKLNKLSQTQISNGEETINKPPPTMKASNSEAIQQNDRSTSNLTSKHAKTFPKSHKVSRIPRAKSFTDEKNQCMLIERSPAEGSVTEKSHNRRCQREPTYSSIHLKNKTTSQL